MHRLRTVVFHAVWGTCLSLFQDSAVWYEFKLEGPRRPPRPVPFEPRLTKRFGMCKEANLEGGGDAPKVSGPYVGYSRRQSHRLCRLCQLSLQFILMIGSWVWQTLEVDFCRYWSASESSRLTCIPSCVATISTSEILSEMTVCELGKSWFQRSGRGLS